MGKRQPWTPAICYFPSAAAIGVKCEIHHAAVSIIVIFSKSQCQIRKSLYTTLHRHRLIVREAMLLRTPIQHSLHKNVLIWAAQSMVTRQMKLISKYQMQVDQLQLGCNGYILLYYNESLGKTTLGGRSKWMPACVSTRACSMSVLASAVKPLIATPIWLSTSATFSMLDGSCGTNRVRGTDERYCTSQQTIAVWLTRCFGGGQREWRIDVGPYH
jgi:hypothetical protein